MALVWFNNFISSPSGKIVTTGVAAAVAYFLYKSFYSAQEAEEEADEYFERVANSKLADCQKRRILIIGLDGSGKSRLCSCLSKGRNNDPTSAPKPTKGFNVKSIQFEATTFDIWDLGGESRFRLYWKEFAKNIDVITYVVDSADSSRILESKEALHMFLSEEVTKGLPLLIVANKQDLEGSLSPTEVQNILGVNTTSRKVKSIGLQMPLGGTRKGIWQTYKYLSTI